MAHYGNIIGIDARGNYKVKPVGGGRIVILEGSRKQGNNFYRGQRILYETHHQGEFVDFAREYRTITTDDNNTSIELSTKAAGDLPSLIQKILSEADTSGISGLLIYDPSEDSSSSYFVSIARTEETAKIPLTMFSEWGFKYDDTNSSYCNSSNGLYGICSHIKGDFKQIVRENPKQRGILFLPIVGLVTRAQSSTKIEPDIFRICVESTIIN